jgi:hypothetical protein
MSFLSRLLSKFLSSARSAGASYRKSRSCCWWPWLGSPEDFGHAHSFEFMHATCRNCGAHWFDVFCVSTGVTGRERVSDKEARLMLETEAGPKRKEFLKAWIDEHL